MNLTETRKLFSRISKLGVERKALKFELKSKGLKSSIQLELLEDCLEAMIHSYNLRLRRGIK